jgi:DNA helicase-2/ATP-dependent DNA helicase PcrA
MNGHDEPGEHASGLAPAPEAVPAIPAEEERLLARVRQSLAEHAPRRRTGPKRAGADKDGAAAGNGGGARPARRSDDALIELRDEIGEARLEDVPALVAQMERLQEVALTRAELQTVLVDADAPYFGHLRLREEVPERGRTGTRVVERDVLIGRSTYVDPAARVNIVDWRDAPVSQLYYRYSEGSDYEERFGDREAEGEILVRRTVTIEGGSLQRVAAPQGIWVKRRASHNGGGATFWERADVPVHELAGGEQSAARPGRPVRARGVLGAAPAGTQRLDRHLPEIAALIDPRQFDLITARDSGVAVIQGGAGSGKTTIGLHRLAYLAHAAPERYPARRMLVVTYGAALAAYIGQVLPALGSENVHVMTFREWAEKELRAAIPWLRPIIVDDPPPAVTRVKSHPALLHDLERRAAAFRGKRGSRAVVELWAELCTDKPRLLALLRGAAEMPISEADILEAHRWMVVRTAAIIARDPRERPPEKKGRRARRKATTRDEGGREPAWEEMGLTEDPSPERPISELPEHVRRTEAERGEVDDDENVRGEIGIDGLRTEDDQPILDLDDVAMLLRAHGLLRAQAEPYAHLFVDEAQDLSPLKLSVLIGRTRVKKGGAPSITLAGDTSQKLFLDNGFGDWRGVLRHLGLDHVAVEPLRIAYRSTAEILALARQAMGALAAELPPVASRAGAPVEAFRFTAVGAAVAFLAEALRDLASREPRATIALLARHPEQADRYFEGLRRAEVPALRRVRAQEFSFRPGVEVTDVRQVKGLEFDYVVMLDANASSFGADDESRHLFHIAVTRAAHQLWLIVTGQPSPLIPRDLLHD